MNYTDLAPQTLALRTSAGPRAEASWMSASSFEDPMRPSSLGVVPARATMPAWLANSVGDRLFIDMLHAFRPTGGLARESELLAHWRGRHGSSAATWHELMGSETVIRFGWSESVWLPLFQFQPGELVPNATAMGVAAELSPHYDGWGIANWFAQPNTWLGNRRPVDMLSDNPARLLEAARVDRFIVAG